MKNRQHDHSAEGKARAEEDRAASSACCGGRFFEITVRGHLNSMWSDWLEGLEVKQLDSGEMVFSGIIVDQAALMGILNKLNRLNLALLSVCQINKAHSSKSNTGGKDGKHSNVKTKR